MKINHPRREILAVQLCAALLAVAAACQIRAAAENPVIDITNRTSLVHLGSLDSFDITARGKEAASLLLAFVENKNHNAAEKALAIYKQIIPDENFGGEYTALQWFLECGLASESERQEKFLADPFVARFYNVLMANDAKDFRSFIRDKYHLPGGAKTKKEQNAKAINRFMEDLILFGNPRRESWEKSSKMIEALALKSGESVADLGSGPGFFSFKFAQLVGPTGKVFAIENNRDHIKYLHDTVRDLGVTNVEPVLVEGGGLGVKAKVDLVFLCSVYHNLYTSLGEEEQTGFFNDFKAALKPGGRLVIVDNGPVSGNLPYHGPYIDRRLIVSQFYHAGFDLVVTHQFIPQRYMLVFKIRPGFEGASELPKYTRPAIPAAGLIAHALKELPPSSQFAEFVNGNPQRVRVLTARSLTPTVGAYPGFSKEGREVAQSFLTALDTGQPATLRAIAEAYRQLAPKERTGDDYSSLEWFCEVQVASPAQKKALLADPQVADYYDYFASNNFKLLKAYLKNKYLLGEYEKHYLSLQRMEEKPERERQGKPVEALKADDEEPTPLAKSGRWLSPAYSRMKLDVDYDTLLGWIEYMAFSSPRREEWEHTSKMVSFLDIRPGQTIADVGSGAGYFTFRFAKLVGSSGRVLGLDTAQEEVDNLARATTKLGYTNVFPMLSKENNSMLPENSVDMAYLCSLYHAVYVTSIEYVKDEFMNSLRVGLKPGGRLVIVENEPVPFESHGFFGPRLAKEVIIAQLQHYGFQFHSFAQFVPERYVLVFTVEKPPMR